MTDILRFGYVLSGLGKITVLIVRKPPELPQLTLSF
jgi:hypothetical protein